MIFNSLEFALFLPIVFLLYWFLFNRNLKLQNLLIVIASYFFYGWWDWRFLFLIFFSTVIDFTAGVLLQKTNQLNWRKGILWFSVIFNLGILGIFKYYNFFIDNFRNAFSVFGYEITTSSLNIILPVGISFYTFQTMSYTIDVYRKDMEPTRNFLAFAAFIGFFPQLVAGPIERAKNLLPQFFEKKKFEYAEGREGLKQILWGLFRKMIIADNCAVYVNLVFDNPSEYDASVLFLGAVLFAFQIYGDFSGYSDIAIGTAKLFGFKLMQNFAYPYFSRDIAEFWRRWHISLSTWFRDYLYIPLGGSKGTLYYRIRNIFIIFLISGFWHGANWTYIFWGGLNALYFMPLMIMKRNRRNLNIVASKGFLPLVKDILAILGTFLLTVSAWIFFRADSLTHAFGFLGSLWDISFFKIPKLDLRMSTKFLLLLIFITMGIEWRARNKLFGIAGTTISRYRIFRWIFYILILTCIGLFFPTEESAFIYFQF